MQNRPNFIDSSKGSDLMKETCFNHVDNEKTAIFCSSERKWINKLLKLHEQRPDEVKIVHYPEDNHGMLYAEIPNNYLKISPPRQTNYTDEQKAAMAERLAAAREKKG
jgi:hypothetical protein